MLFKYDKNRNGIVQLEETTFSTEKSTTTARGGGLTRST